MKWAIVFYALIQPLSQSESVEHISWQLTFNHHEQCIAFYERNKNDLVAGLKNYAKEHYQEPIMLKEIGCAHATANFDIPQEDRAPVVSLQMPLWTGETI